MIDYLFYSEKYCKICLKFKSETYICDECLNRLDFVDGKKELDYCVCYYPLFYNNYIKEIIKKFKYSSETHLVKPFVEILYKFYNIKEFNFDYVTYIPMTKKDEYKRGYNQSELLAKYLSEYIEVKFIKIANKNINTKHQNKLARIYRTENLMNSFEIVKGLKLNNKKILIVDDLITTGSTANYISKEIKKEYYVDISFLTIASSKIDTDY